MGTRTPNQLIKSQLLYQLSYRGNTGTFYGRATVDGKIYRESLKTTVFSVAKQKLPDYVKEKLRNMQIDCQSYAYEHGVDKPEVDQWTWR